MKRLLVFVVIILVLGSISIQAAEADLTGTWSGLLKVPGMELDLVFEIARDEHGIYVGSLDVPAQGAYGISLSQVALEEGKAVFEVRLIGGVFSGELNSTDSKLEGLWSQGGADFPLVLERLAAEDIRRPNRPQEPEPPYPYRQEEAIYPNRTAGIELAGTLTIPTGEGPFPAVVLISGSGQQDRNEEAFGHKPFLVLADYLTRRGIAVLRFDDRGIGGSGGVFDTATTLDFGTDVLAGVEFLKTKEEIDSSRLGLIGHSEGGLIAPLAAAECSDVAFIVLLAAPGLSGAEIILLQTDLIYRASGIPEQIIARENDVQKELFQIILEEQDETVAAVRMRRTYLAYLDGLSGAERQAIEDEEAWIAGQTAALLAPWMKFFLAYEPAPTLAQVSCPVLAIGGSQDLQVPAAENLPVLEQALKDGGNENYTVRELPGLNHLFQTASSGLPAEYGTIEETMSPLALEVVGDWLLEVAR